MSVPESIRQWEKAKTIELLDELNGMVGAHSPTPRDYRDWNGRARMFLVFAACQRIGYGDLASVGLAAAASATSAVKELEANSDLSTGNSVFQ